MIVDDNVQNVELLQAFLEALPDCRRFIDGVAVTGRDAPVQQG